jgi:hypothetical protein
VAGSLPQYVFWARFAHSLETKSMNGIITGVDASRVGITRTRDLQLAKL